MKRRPGSPVVALAALLVPLIAAALACTPFGNAPSEQSPTDVPTATESTGCVLPDVVGLDEAAAREALADLGLTALSVAQRNDTVEKGIVIGLAPSPGTTIDPCTGEVTLIVSSGPASEKATVVPPSPVPPSPVPVSPVPVDTGQYPDQDDIPWFWNSYYEERFEAREYGFTPGLSVDVSGDTSDIQLDEGRLVINGYLAAYVGDTTYYNYRVTFGGGYFDEIQEFHVLTRMQDRRNYVGLECFPSGGLECVGRKVVDGRDLPVTGFQDSVRFCVRGQMQCDLALEARGNQFSVYVNGEQVAGFTDDTFESGGVGFVTDGKLILDYFHVYEVPFGASLGYTVYRDDFDTESWSVGVDDGDYAVTYKAVENGVYHWKVTAKQGVVASEIREIWPTADSNSYPYRFAYSADARLVSAPKGAAHGLLFRAVDYYNFYYFRVEDSGSAGLYALVDNEWSEIAGPVQADAFKVGEMNELRVVAEGERFSFWINGQYLFQATDERFTTGGIGVAVELMNEADEGEFEFDNIRIGIPPQ